MILITKTSFDNELHNGFTHDSWFTILHQTGYTSVFFFVNDCN